MKFTYKCKTCGILEIDQRIGSNPIEVCPKCGGEITRIITLLPVIYKCNGFYSTDQGG